MANIDKNINKIKRRNKIIIIGIISILVIAFIALGVTFKIKSDKEQVKAEVESMNLLAKKEAEDSEVKVNNDNNKVNSNENKESTSTLDSKGKYKNDYNNYESSKNLENDKQVKEKKDDKEVNNNEVNKVNKVEENLKAEKVYTSTVLYDQTGANYDPSNLNDGKSNTIWAEGVMGPGIGEFMTIDFNKERLVKKLYIINGSAKSQRLYYANNRIKTVRVDFQNGDFRDVELKDGELGEQEIDLGDGEKTSYVRFIILSVYNGNKYDDTCVSELKAVGYN